MADRDMRPPRSHLRAKNMGKFLLGLLIGLVIGVVGITKIADKRLINQAIGHKLGEYTVNRTNGEVQFTWFPPPTNGVVIVREYR